MAATDKTPTGNPAVSDNRNVSAEPVASGDKTAAAEEVAAPRVKADTSPLQGGSEVRPPAREEQIGRIIAGARESRGLSPKDVAREAHVPEYYVKMIESDDYSLIADQIYLLPFLRRYAEFVGLDAEEIAGRFVRDVQRADVNAARMSDPIPMLKRKSGSNRRFIAALVVAAALGMAIAFLVARYMRMSRLSSAFTTGAPAESERIPASQPSAPRADVPARPPAPAEH